MMALLNPAWRELLHGTAPKPLVYEILLKPYQAVLNPLAMPLDRLGFPKIGDPNIVPYIVGSLLP